MEKIITQTVSSPLQASLVFDGSLFHVGLGCSQLLLSEENKGHENAIPDMAKSTFLRGHHLFYSYLVESQ